MKLVAQSGPLVGQDFSIPEGKSVVVIGRGSTPGVSGDILLADPQVSRHHAELRFSGGQVTITDAGSTNGTFVNGQRIQGTRILRSSDMLRIGATTFVLQEGAALAQAASVEGASVLPVEPPMARKSSLWLILGGLAALVILALIGVGAFLVMRRSSSGSGAPLSAQATLTAIQQATPVVPPGTPTPGGPTATSLVQLFVTLTPKPGLPTVTASAGGGGAAPATPQVPPFTVSWSPGRYEGWADGRRMSSDLTIQNVSLPEIKPPYTPYFIISDPTGKMRQADLQDYGGGKGPPTIARGQTIMWTWFGVMSNQEWVRGSVFRYAGYAWAQEFNPDGSLNGPPRVIDEKQLIPFLPKQISPELLPTLAATMAAGGGAMPTGIPTGIPAGLPTGIPTAKP